MTFAHAYLLTLAALAMYVVGVSALTTRVSYPLYAAAGASMDAPAPQATQQSRSDPRLGSLSRHYRPRTAQFQRTHS